MNIKHIFEDGTKEFIREIELIDCGTKGQSFSKQCLHHLQFMKTNFSKLARTDIRCQFMKQDPCAELFTK